VWLQQAFDQNGIVRQYTKWDYQLKLQDNPGLIVSRALQVACSEPRGPVYLSIPPEVSLGERSSIHFPTAEQLGLAKPAAPDGESIRQIADRLLRAENPVLVVARSGRNPATVAPLVSLCERLGLPVASSTKRAYHCFPLAHPLYQSEMSLKDADLVLALDVDIPWKISADAPTDEAYVAVVDQDPAKGRIPTMEFTADLRITADSLLAIEAIDRAITPLITASDSARFSARAKRWADVSADRRRAREEDAKSFANSRPIDRRWLSYVIGQTLDDRCIVFDDTIVLNQVHDYLRCSEPGSYFYNPGSSGGWAPGAAFGAKLAAPDRDVVAITGDGFYMFGAPVHSLWSAAHYNAPYMTIIYQNRSYTTGTLRVARNYPNGFAARANYPGGYFEPPIDFALEAQAAGAYGENVVDPDQVEPALRRGLERIRSGQCAVISVRLPRLLQEE
jgi:acetolactate synthase-1/2/3 large subunit